MPVAAAPFGSLAGSLLVVHVVTPETRAVWPSTVALPSVALPSVALLGYAVLVDTVS
jgi:hypothetical protein